MRRLLLSTAALFLSAQVILSSPARADYAAAEAALQAGNIASAVPLLAEEAKLGNPVAAFNLGKIYLDGAAGVPDFTQAATYFRIAAEIDTAPRYNGAALGAQGPQLIAAAQMYGQYELGRLYETGKGVPQDYNEAVGWYTRAADLGNIKSMLKLAIVQREGLPGIAPDLASSTSWLQRAAEAGSIPAALELGRAYQGGIGVTPNPQEAAKWYEAAAAGGAISAEYGLGTLYRNGMGGQPDFVRAVEHFERGANAKDAASMLALGDLYASGQGVPADKVQAHTWYSLAADQGATDGSAKAAALAQGMTQQELTAAVSLHDNWRPQAKEEAMPAAAPAPAPALASPAPAAAPAASPDLPPLFEESAPTAPAAAVPAPAPAPVIVPPATTEAVPAAPAPLPTTTPPTTDPFAPTDPFDPFAPPAPGAPQPGAKPFEPTQ
jgi:TPR repeat protein